MSRHQHDLGGQPLNVGGQEAQVADEPDTDAVLRQLVPGAGQDTSRNTIYHSTKRRRYLGDRTMQAETETDAVLQRKQVSLCIPKVKQMVHISHAAHQY